MMFGIETIGRYQVHAGDARVLGRGGFATVYRAIDGVRECDVAIKVLAAHHSLDLDVRARFLREARLLDRVAKTSRRVVTVYDIEELPSGEPYFVMELAERGSLANRIDALAGAPRWGCVRWLIEELAECMSALHDQNIAHRDIKPSNVLIRGAPLHVEADDLCLDGERLVLVDLGVAKDLETSVSAASLVVGTEGFMAPEIVEDPATINHRVDIFSASMLVARLHHWHPTADDVPPSGLPARYVDALRRGIARDPDVRHPTAVAWADDLLAALDENGIRVVAGTAPPPTGQIGEAPIGPAPDDADSAQGRRLGRLVRNRLAVAGLLAVVGVGWLASRDSPVPIGGPDSLEAGATAEFTLGTDEAAGAVTWTVGSQTVVDDESIDISPTAPGRLRIVATWFDPTGRENTTERSVAVTESPDAPTIDGPSKMLVGETFTLTASTTLTDAIMFWSDHTGVRHDSRELTITPTGSGALTIRLHQVEPSGRELITSTKIDVVER